MYRAAKRDKNEREIIDALLKIGCTVQQLDDAYVPDLLVGYITSTGDKINILMEVKNKKGTLKKGQIAWHESWKGQVAVVRTVEEALDLFD